MRLVNTCERRIESGSGPTSPVITTSLWVCGRGGLHQTQRRVSAPDGRATRLGGANPGYPGGRLSDSRGKLQRRLETEPVSSPARRGDVLLEPSARDGGLNLLVRRVEDSRLVDGLDAPIAHDKTSIHQHTLDVVANSLVHQSVHRHEVRHEVRLAEVDDDDVGFLADVE